MSKVYIVQQPRRVQREGEKVVSVSPAYNYDPARVYGELEYCLNSGNARFSARQTVLELRRALKDFTVDDYILPSGDPGIIGVAVAIAAHLTNGRVKVLRWMRQEKTYLVMEYEIFH